MKHVGDVTKLNGAELPLWSSEIEKNAQAVLKYHWPEDNDESK